jgi:hypothetical protein
MQCAVEPTGTLLVTLVGGMSGRSVKVHTLEEFREPL